MPVPFVAPRMEKTHHGAGRGIDSAEIGPLVEITAMAGQSEIIDLIGATVLARNHMFNVMHEFTVVLVKPAVLANLTGPITNELPGSGIHR